MSTFASYDRNENMLGPLAKDFPILWTADTFVEKVASTDGREIKIDALPVETRNLQHHL